MNANILPPKQLPDEVDALKKLVINLTDEVANLSEKNTEYAREIERLREQFLLAQQRRFGRKSEKSQDQLSLFDEMGEPVEEDNDSLTEEQEVLVKPRKRARALPKTLPREIIHYDLPEAERNCACGHTLHKIGTQSYEQLEYIPAQVKIIEHVKAKYGCRACESVVKVASMPKQPIPKSFATPGLLAQTLTAKYAYHLPLYRQEKMLERLGIELGRSTLSGWVFGCADLLQPLADELRQVILHSGYACADETRVTVISKQPERSHCYMWVFMAGPPGQQAVVFNYDATRAAKVAEDFLEGFSGYLQSDGFSGYNKLRKKSHITGIGCFAHARRKFYEITKLSKKTGAADVAISMIAKLYKQEKLAKKERLNSLERYQLRQEKSVPVLNEFKKWLDRKVQQAPPTSALGKAIAYTLNQWQVLENYCLDGRVEIDNNGIERMIKPFATGRKNWLFQGNERGARASAVIYSLVQTCLINGIEPYGYLRHVLTVLPNLSDLAAVKELLPYNYTKHPSFPS